MSVSPLQQVHQPDHQPNLTEDIAIYFHTNNLDADMTRVRELGGRILLERLDIINFGALGIFIDPMGNRVAFWQSAHPS